MLMPTRIAPMPSGVTVHAVLSVVGVVGVFDDDAVSAAGGVVDAGRDVSPVVSGCFCFVSMEQPALEARRSVSIDRKCTARSLEVESASEMRFPCPVG
jgi:hypothetical protein